MKNERQWRDDVLRRLERLADQKANDAVKLAFLDGERVDSAELSAHLSDKKVNFIYPAGASWR